MYFKSILLDNIYITSLFSINMGNDNSGVRFVTESRENFLHELKGVVLNSKSEDIERKRVYGKRAVYLLFNMRLVLQLSDNDMPDPESSASRNLFILDGYQASQLRTYLSEDLESLETYGGREFIINQFYNEAMEIVNRAVLRYESIVDKLK